MDEVRHRLQVRPEHQAPLVADVAHLLELLVDDHEELVDLLLVAQEVQQCRLALGVRLETAQPERAADGVHADLAVLHADVALRAGAHEVAVAREDAERPEGAPLALEQATQHRERLGVAPRLELRAVMPADDEVRALTLPDLVVDDAPHDLRVVVVARLEPPAVGELHGDVGQLLEELGEADLDLQVGADHAQRGAVLACLVAPFADLGERHEDEVVPRGTVTRDALGDGDVGERLDVQARSADQRDGVGLARADQGEGRLGQELVQQSGHGASSRGSPGART